MFPAFTIKMLKGKVASTTLILLDGIYKPPLGPEKVFFGRIKIEGNKTNTKIKQRNNSKENVCPSFGDFLRFF